MKRNIYLIRHARARMPAGNHFCIGLTDIPLDEEGKAQAEEFGKEFISNYGRLPVYCSYLKRSIQTAQTISDSPIVIDGLEEMFAGEWDGLSFDEIAARWPDLYAMRGSKPFLDPPGAETPEAAQERFFKAILSVLSGSEGDIAVVAHSSVIQSFLCLVSGKEPGEAGSFKLKHCSVSTVCEEDGNFSLLSYNCGGYGF